MKDSVANSLRGVPQLKAYVRTLNKYKQQMSGENLILLNRLRSVEIVLNKCVYH